MLMSQSTRSYASHSTFESAVVASMATATSHPSNVRQSAKYAATAASSSTTSTRMGLPVTRLVIGTVTGGPEVSPGAGDRRRASGGPIGDENVQVPRRGCASARGEDEPAAIRREHGK